MNALYLMLILSTSAQAGKRSALHTPEPPQRPVATYADRSIDTMSTGSLWSGVTARQMMGLDGNARRTGDLITVQITENVATNLNASTETSKKGSTNANLKTLLGVEKTIRKAHPNLSEDEVIALASEATFAGRGETGRNAQVQAILTCEVLEVLPTGNLRIWGWKQVQVNRETQYVVLDGIVRPRDIQMDNTVDSQLLSQAKIEVTGTGVVGDKQGPGWLSRILDKLWPF
jgi:flagellar L-ring protein precursor FlgH